VLKNKEADRTLSHSSFNMECYVFVKWLIYPWNVLVLTVKDGELSCKV